MIYRQAGLSPFYCLKKEERDFIAFTPLPCANAEMLHLAPLSMRSITLTAGYVSYLCLAAPGGGRDAAQAGPAAVKLPARGQTRGQSTSPHVYMLPTPWETPAGRMAAGSQTHCPNWRAIGRRSNKQINKYL